ncbi:hypothetical protein VKT23_010635 [Stygiomarasmius scandens]|uniref:F-box domain-containing protein n=1 Tax=Marasmiellus scandens TaxID=2682957 RepID=A0ABR1JDI4_9AGAR
MRNTEDINKLPVELLDEIFEYACAESPAIDFLPYPVTLSLVCRRWRFIILGTPERPRCNPRHWRRLEASLKWRSFPEDPDPLVEMVTKYISLSERPNPIPLRVVLKNGAVYGSDDDHVEMLEKYPNDLPSQENIIDTLLPVISRLETVKLHMPFGFLERDMPNPLPQRPLLRSFSLTITNRHSFPSHGNLGFLGIIADAPELTELSFSSWSRDFTQIPDSLSIPWNQLTKLELRMVGAGTVSNLQDILKRAVNLETAKLTVDGWGSSPPLNVDDDPFPLTRLRTLQLEFHNECCDRVFLKPFAFPRLEAFTLIYDKHSYGYIDVGEILIGMVKRTRSRCGSPSFPLSTLKLKFDHGGLESSALFDFMRDVDTLVHLECPCLPEMSTFLEPLTIRAKEPVLGANLLVLQVFVVDFDEEKLKCVLDFLTSRGWFSEANKGNATAGRLEKFTLVLNQDILDKDLERSEEWKRLSAYQDSPQSPFEFCSGKWPGPYQKPLPLRRQDTSLCSLMSRMEKSINSGLTPASSRFSSFDTF